MTERNDEEIINDIKNLLEEYVKPAVAEHGGNIDFVDYNKGTLKLLLGGACSGCAGSMMTLKMGVEQLIKHHIPEVTEVVAEDDPNSNVDPFYMHTPFDSRFPSHIDEFDNEF